MSSSRRDFLKASGLVVMGGASGFMGFDQFVRGEGDPSTPVKANEDRQKATIVTIFLRGGADALHVFVPVGDPLYYQYRKNLVLKASPTKGAFKAEKGIVQLGKSDYWGMNAKMASLLPLIDKGTVVPILNVGSPNGTRSHFSAQDYMERAAPGENAVTTGWLNRYLEATKKPYDAPLRGLSAQNLVPRALRGNYPVLAGNNSTEEMDLFADLYSKKNLVNMNAREGGGNAQGSSLDQLNTREAPKGLSSDMTRDIIAQSGANAVERIKALEQVANTDSDADYPGGGLSNQLRTIARVIKANVGLEVAQADAGGWDTHSGQGNADGHMSKMLGSLADNLVAFQQDLGPRMNRVIVLVMSEFGRTVHENGSNGTDHGRAGMMIAMGGMLNGGKLYGTWNGLKDLEGGRFQPVHTDFRAVFAESINKLFGVDPMKLKLFPEWNPTAHSLLDFAKPVKIA
ncbi:MAG TPA: DUF1501 domain-containing protein [Tepidisphaeraceae bacterium]|nr:DUF1501 domain-containing protein [Tepidisphaeraceae bacterium]